MYASAYICTSCTRRSRVTVRMPAQNKRIETSHQLWRAAFYFQPMGSTAQQTRLAQWRGASTPWHHRLRCFHSLCIHVHLKLVCEACAAAWPIYYLTTTLKLRVRSRQKNWGLSDFNGKLKIFLAGQATVPTFHEAVRCYSLSSHAVPHHEQRLPLHHIHINFIL